MEKIRPGSAFVLLFSASWTRSRFRVDAILFSRVVKKNSDKNVGSENFDAKAKWHELVYVEIENRGTAGE